MATVEGAQASGLGDEIGSLEVGKQADLILVDLTALNLSPVLEAPVRNIVPNLVYAGTGHEVKTVMVAGKVLVRDGLVLAADEEAIRAEAYVRESICPARCGRPGAPGNGTAGCDGDRTVMKTWNGTTM